VRKAAAGLLLALATAAPATAETVLRARLNADIAASDPRSKRDANTDAVLLHVIEGLVALRENGSVGPMLASDWTVSPDGRTYRFRLRPGVRFHDGTPLTAGEVVWSLKRYLAPDSRWRCKPELGPKGVAPVTSITAPDAQTVVVTLGRPAPLFLHVLVRSDCAGTGIVSRASLAPGGAWRQPVGTGPFAWSEWRRSQYVELRRHVAYQSLPGPRDGIGGGKRPLADRVRFSVIPDGSAASAALLRGSLDVLDGLASNELGALRAPGISFTSAPGMDLYGILFQTRDPLLADPRMRRAIALSLDVTALTRAATHGTAAADSSPIPTASPFYGPAQRAPIRRDLAAARALAKAAGYRGQTIKLITSRAPPEAFDAAIIIQAMAREAGIRIEIINMDWASELQRYQTGAYQAVVFGFSPRMDPSWMYSVLIGDKAEEPRKVWDTPRARDLLRQSMATEDPAQRQAAFDALEAEFRRDAPAVVLFNTKRVTAVRAGVTGYASWPGQLQRLWGVAKAR